ncbi:hypothetical protein AB0L85_02795 [Streptomyces sp. NPDC052051]|uniref:hypothetical protein n=1 Tax=Streptomyces sp. NPDC052051 TaxID=3154649 RepID=UPI00342D0AF4
MTSEEGIRVFSIFLHRRKKSAHFIVAALCIAATSACTSNEEPAATPTITAAPSVAAPPTDTGVANSAQVTAERVKNTISDKLDVHLTKYGEGVTSPCRATAASLFDQRCLDAAESIKLISDAALAEIKGKTGFSTLRRAATHAAESVQGYTELHCSEDPAEVAVRATCVDHGASIAQASADLRDGLRLGLAGK